MGGIMGLGGGGGGIGSLFGGGGGGGGGGIGSFGGSGGLGGDAFGFSPPTGTSGSGNRGLSFGGDAGQGPGFGDELTTGFIGSTFSAEGPFGYEKSASVNDAATQADPLTREANRLKLDQQKAGLAATGGFGKLFGPDTQRFFTFSPEAQQSLMSFRDSALLPGLTPEQWYGQSLAHLDPSFYTQAANNLLGQVIQPNLQSQYASMGLGRSGAMGEALARAGAQLTLPIAQQQLQNLFSLNQQRPNVEATLRDLALRREYSAFQVADIPRQLDLQKLQRDTIGAQSALALTPYVAGQESRAINRQYGNLIMDLIGMFAPAIAGALGGAIGGPIGAGIGGSTGSGQPASSTSGQAGFTPPVSVAYGPTFPAWPQSASAFSQPWNQGYGNIG